MVFVYLTVAPDPPAWKLIRSQVPFPCVQLVWVKSGKYGNRTNGLPVPGSDLKSINREVNPVGEIVFPNADRGIDGD